MNVSIAARSHEFDVYRVFAVTFPVGFAQIINLHVFASLVDGGALFNEKTKKKRGGGGDELGMALELRNGPQVM